MRTFKGFLAVCECLLVLVAMLSGGLAMFQGTISPSDFGLYLASACLLLLAIYLATVRNGLKD
jgi:hypothetical protein